MQNTWLVVALGLVIGCGSSASLSRSDGSAGGATGGAGGQAGIGGGAGGRAGIGGGGRAGGGGAMDGGQDRPAQILDGAADRHVVSDAKTCTGTFTCVLCSTDDVSIPGVCSDGGWTCPGGYAAGISQCPPCSGLPPPYGCTCNHSNGVITCPKDAGTDK